MNLVVIVVFSVIVFALILVLFPSGGKSDIQARLAQLNAGEDQTALISAKEEELSKPFVDRVIRPILANLAGKRDQADIRKVQKSSLRKQLAQAGYPGNLTVQEFSVIQMLFRILLPTFFVAIGMLAGYKINQLVLIAVIGLGFGVLLPRMFLQRTIAIRMHAVTRQLPDVLDLLTVCVEAGLGFDQSCDKVVEKMKGPIPDEFSLTLRQMRMGQARRDAFKDMADRLQHGDLSAFISALIQADQLGVSIGQVLRIQSEQLRDRRRQRAEEEAAKAPVKMMIPLVFFIFPNVGVVIGCPAMFQILEELSKTGMAE